MREHLLKSRPRHSNPKQTHTMSTMTILKAWLRSATPAERQQLAERAGTSAEYLKHLSANEDTNYRREPKPALAAAIERETRVLNKSTNGRLPIVYRTDLVEACRQCEFAKRCLGEQVAARGAFPVIVADESEGGNAD